MKVSPHGLDVMDGIAGFDGPPLRHNVIGSRNPEQLLQNQRTAFARFLAEGQDARVIAVKREMVGMRFQRGVDEILVRHHVKLELLAVFLRIDIENSEQHLERKALVQELDFHQIREIGDKAVGLAQQDRRGLLDLIFNQQNFLSRAEQGFEIGYACRETLAEEAAQGLGERHLGGMWGALVQQHIIEVDGKHLLGLLPKVAGAFQLGPLYNRIRVGRGWIGQEMRLKEVLISAELRPAEFESRFKALCGAVQAALVQALVIDAFDFDDRADCAGLGDKAPVVNEAEYAALLSQGAGLAVILDKFSDVKHGCKFSSRSRARICKGRIRRGMCVQSPG